LLKKAGYKRIGMAVEPEQNHHHRGIFIAAYLMQQSKLPISRRIPPLLSFGPWREATFRRWMERYQPDVLYIHPNPNFGPSKESGNGHWIDNMKLRVPEDISLFSANVQRSDYSGLRRDYVSMGQSAVELVSLLLGNNLLGLAGNPRSWLVDEIWQSGRSLLRPINKFIS
jgi:LacI family transcriptional regulator